jgi:FAD/FMN-containing dehydrogenase
VPAATVDAGLADALRARLAGDVIGPGDAGYERRRRVSDARAAAHPVAIARCTSRDDVAAALAVAADRGLPLAVRGGGTSGRGAGDGALVLDLAPMEGIAVDADARIAHVGPGARWAALDEATQEHGLAVTGARVSRLGVGGVALGDGSGWLERALGPTGLSLAGAELVLADGRELEVGEDTPELLWALRGAGARLGVVTRLDLRLHPVGPELLCGFLGFPRDRAREVAGAYVDYMRDAPDAVGGGLLLGAGRGGACSIVFCHAGTVAEGEAAVAPLRALGPSLDAVAPNDYRALQALWDAGNPPGTRVHVRAGFLRELSSAGLDAAVELADQPAAALSYVFLQPLGGALARIPADAMALCIPRAPWAYRAVGLWPPVPALDAGQAGWVDGFAAALAPATLDAEMPSLAETGPAGLARTYGREGSERLRAVARDLGVPLVP